MIKIKISPSDLGSEIAYEEGMLVIDVLNRLKYHPASCVKFVNGIIATDDKPLRDGDELILIEIIEGG